MRNLVSLLLPLNDKQQQPFDQELFDRVRDELTKKFGGVTAFRRAAAEGLWKHQGEIDREEVVLFEVMTDTLDRDWWSSYRRHLESRFQQEQIVIRSFEFEQL